MEAEPIHVFYSYSHKDEAHREALETHLTMLRRDGLIKEWSDRKIVPGEEIDHQVDANLKKADLILLLVSPDFLASDYCWDKEMKYALDRHESGSAYVVPIIVRPGEWKSALFAKVKALPKDAKPVTTWDNADLAWLDVARGIRETVQKINSDQKRVRQQHQFQPLRSVLSRGIDQIDEMFRYDSSVIGLPTGFADLDSITAGLQPGDLVVLAGRPSMGKTSFALNISENVALGKKVPVAIFSGEMQSEQLGMRMMAALGRINSHKIRTGRLEDDDWPRLTHAIGLLADSPIFIDDSRMRSITSIVDQARKLKDEHGLALVVIDSLTLFVDEGVKSELADVSQLAKTFKNLAKELDTPVIVISNVSRDVEMRSNKRPVLADLDGASDIAQYADVVLFLYRDEVYNNDPHVSGMAEVIVAKQRNGPVGKVRLTFLSELCKFENYADPELFGKDQ